MRLSGIGVGLLINFYVTHLRDGIKRMVDGKTGKNSVRHFDPKARELFAKLTQGTQRNTG